MNHRILGPARALSVAALCAATAFGLAACDSSGTTDDDDFEGNPEEVIIEATITPAAGGSIAYEGIYSLSGLDGANMGDIVPDGAGEWSISDVGIGILIDLEVATDAAGSVTVTVEAGGEVVRTETVAPGEDEIITYFIPD